MSKSHSVGSCMDIVSGVLLTGPVQDSQWIAVFPCLLVLTVYVQFKSLWTQDTSFSAQTMSTMSRLISLRSKTLTLSNYPGPWD